jgi:uncharacterized membrane protein
MKNDTRLAIFLGGGFLLILLGSMPLNGYLGFLLWPNESHHDAFMGTMPHLLLGLIPWWIGIVLITIGSQKTLHVLMIGLASIGGGCFMAISSIINAKDSKGWLCWLAIYALGVTRATIGRKIHEIHSRTSYRAS